MNKKIIILILIIIFVISSLMLLDNFIINKMRFDFDEVLDEENPDDLVFKVYYCNPYVLTLNMTPQEMLESGHPYFFSASGEELVEYYDLFRQIDSSTLIPFKGKIDFQDCSIYYVLESKKNGKIFDVAIGGFDEKQGKFCLYFNGRAIESNQIFYDLYEPFVPDYLK